MSSSTGSLNDSIEAVDLVGGVGDLAHVAVGLHQAVGAVDDAVLQRLGRVLVVPSRGVRYAVREAVRWVRVDGLSTNHL